jgi:hypothetical protein
METVTMTKTENSQINEIAKDLCSKNTICTCVEKDGHCSTPQKYARIICDLGYRKQRQGVWKRYSSTMMECSVCKKHVSYHKYEFCPHCGSVMEEF